MFYIVHTSLHISKRTKKIHRR